MTSERAAKDCVAGLCLILDLAGPGAQIPNKEITIPKEGGDRGGLDRVDHTTQLRRKFVGANKEAGKAKVSLLPACLSRRGSFVVVLARPVQTWHSQNGK